MNVIYIKHIDPAGIFHRVALTFKSSKATFMTTEILEVSCSSSARHSHPNYYDSLLFPFIIYIHIYERLQVSSYIFFTAFCGRFSVASL